MDLTDWNITPDADGNDDFLFCEDGYDLCVMVWHDYDPAYKQLHWQVDEYFLVDEWGNMVTNDNAGMSHELFSAYEPDIKHAIETKLVDHFKPANFWR